MDDRDTRFMGVVGRLEPGLDLDAARARMEAAMEVLVREWPENAGRPRSPPLRPSEAACCSVSVPPWAVPRRRPAPCFAA
jgi:hypothetical protein